MTKLKQVFIIGGLIRFLLPTLVPNLVEILASTVEISTPINSFKSLQEALFYMNNGINLYDGAVNCNAPLYVTAMSVVDSLPFSQIWFNLVFALADLYITWRLLHINKWYNKHNQERTGKSVIGFNDDLIASFYLFNPLLIFTNIAHSSLCFTLLFIVESISQVVINRSISRSMISLALASYLSFTPVYLIVPILALGHSLEIDLVEKIYVMGIALFSSTLALLSLVSFAITASWQYLQSTYGTIIFFDKITPNIGLWWYIFTEMFQFFTPFYVGIFNLYQFIFIIPITLRLFEFKKARKLGNEPIARLALDNKGNLKAIDENGVVTDITGLLPSESTSSGPSATGATVHETTTTSREKEQVKEPTKAEQPISSTATRSASTGSVDASQVNGDSFLAVVLCCVWLSFTKSYPTVGDLGFCLSLLPIFKATVFPHCKYPFITGLTLLVCLLLSPIFYYCWIVLGNGNSNFFYSINLIWGVVHALVLIDLLWGKLTLDFILQNSISNSEVDKLRLTQI